MEDKLQSTIEKIVQLSKQNTEFNLGLRKRLDMSSANCVPIDDDRIDQIYEYCIEKVVRQQAQEFYKDFPIKEIITGLVDDFCRMEAFRRRNNFGDFCLSLYQQVECVTNKLCANPDLNEIANRMWGYPAYVKAGKGVTPSIDNRNESGYTIASLVFPGNDKNSGLSNAIEKSKKSLQDLYAIDKMRTIVYFVGYKGMMKNNDYYGFKEFTSLLWDIYQCRNTNHRGNIPNNWDKEPLSQIRSQQAVYYFKFLGELTQFMEQIIHGWNELPEIKRSVLMLPPKKVE